MDDGTVRGYCPACGWPSLFIGAAGHIACSRIDCPRPTAVDEILADRETEHVVQFDPGEFTVRHPLRERLDDTLMDCPLHHHIAGMDGPPVRPGRYRARENGDRWTWEALPASDGTEDACLDA